MSTVGNIVQAGAIQIIGSYATIIVTGSIVQTDTVTASQNGTIINGVWNGTGFTLSPIASYGTWTVLVSGSVSKTQDVLVDTATTYTVTISTSQSLTFADFSDYLDLNSTYSQSGYSPVADFYTCGAYNLVQRYVWMRTTLPIDISSFSDIRVAGYMTKASGDSSGVITVYMGIHSSGSEGGTSSLVTNATALDSVTGSSVTYKAYDNTVSLSNYKALYGNSVYIYLGIRCASNWWGYGYYTTAVTLS